MTIGVGGATMEQALAQLTGMTADIVPITTAEFQTRIKKAQALMQREGMAAIYINAGTNLYYFTGTRWSASERMVGAVIPAVGPVEYIAPAFEESTLLDFMRIKGRVHCWQEHESPYLLFGDILQSMGVTKGTIGLDESAAYFLVCGVSEAAPHYSYTNAKAVTAGCRMQKSPAELALMQQAKTMTIAVHKAAARVLSLGVSTGEMTAFIDKAHRAVGAAGSSFCIVLFGEATAYPHGVKDPQCLKDGDMVLIDTGCVVEGYNSDITRSYVFGTANDHQRAVWNSEKAAQAAAFTAAKIGVAAGDVDGAARHSLETDGYGPGYDVPGLPHRTGHGIGLDIHEWPYLVRGDETPLAPGMCFSNEPMICIYGAFGVRLEDHFYMTDDGPKWFTKPSHSIDDPFGLKA